MMQRLFLTCAAALTLILSLHILPGTSARGDDSGELIDKALKASGIMEQLDVLVPVVLASIPGRTFGFAERRRWCEKYVMDQVTAQDLVTTMRAAVRNDFHEDRLRQVLDFYQSRLGRRVGSVQGKVLTSQAMRDVQEGHASVTTMSEKRLDLIKRILEAQGAAKSNAAMIRIVTKGLADGFLVDDAPGKEQVLDTLRSLLEGSRSVKDLTDDLDLVAYSRTYRSLTDGELEELLQYHLTEPARWFGEVVRAGSEQAVYKIARTLGESLRSVPQVPRKERKQY